MSIHLVVLPFVAALAATLFLSPGRRTRLLFLGGLAALLLSLIAQSTPRQVGDSAQYVVMARNLAHFSRPSVTPGELMQARVLFPGDAGAALDMPAFVGADGRQDFPHFWFYPLLAAPLVRVAETLGAKPTTAFTMLNFVLVMLLAALLVARISFAASLFVVAGPIFWWMDKAHTEPFTVVLIATALVFLWSSPWWSIVALGTAATQNPPMAGAMLIAVAVAFYKHGWRERRLWIALVAGLLLASLHPVYYHSRLGVWTGFFQSVDYHWPSFREIFTVPFDPNLGIFVHDPILAVAMMIALVEAATRPGRPGLGVTHGAIALIAIFFLLVFSQVLNVNSGGTPDPSRYGLWLVPFVIPVFSGLATTARWPRVLAALSVLWCAAVFAPDLPDQNLRPTALAANLWTQWPSVDNPVAEVFAERVAGQESARPPVATPGCEKLLLMGDGTDAPWPSRCGTYQIAGFCGEHDAVCYANRDGNGYRFVRAASSPMWRAAMKRQSPTGVRDGMLTITQATEPRLPMALWHDEGWSYPERLAEATSDVYSRQWRWMADEARLGVMSSRPLKARVKLVAGAFNKPRRVRISIGQTEIVTLVVSESRAEYQTPPFDLPMGSTLIVLQSLDGSESPATGDPRRLSVAVFHVELVVGEQ